MELEADAYAGAVVSRYLERIFKGDSQAALGIAMQLVKFLGFIQVLDEFATTQIDEHPEARTRAMTAIDAMTNQTFLAPMRSQMTYQLEMVNNLCELIKTRICGGSSRYDG